METSVLYSLGLQIFIYDSKIYSTSDISCKYMTKNVAVQTWHIPIHKHEMVDTQSNSWKATFLHLLEASLKLHTAAMLGPSQLGGEEICHY